jgi:3-phosphoglycerate kinase
LEDETLDIPTLEDYDFSGKRVLLRVDFNVPLDEEGNITNDKRITATIPTIKGLLERGVEQVILMSHLGRPEGKVVERLKMDRVGERLSEVLGMPVSKLDDCVDVEIPGARLVLLENLRFHPEEKEDDDVFAKKLASMADVYVNDAFGTCHRRHASVHAVTKYLPSFPGFLVQKEMEVMGRAMADPVRPFVAILGGAKVSDKIGLIENLQKICDHILIGGAMQFTFLKSQGVDVGDSKVEEDKIGLAERLLESGKIVLPVDTVVAEKIEQGTETRVVPVDEIPSGWMGLDIGPSTIGKFQVFLKDAGTVLWNGPMGVFEIAEFSKGTEKIARYLSELDAITIVGGGDSAAAVEKLGLEEKMTHVSTGGGACLSFFEGKKMPGIEGLRGNP